MIDIEKLIDDFVEINDCIRESDLVVCIVKYIEEITGEYYSDSDVLGSIDRMVFSKRLLAVSCTLENRVKFRILFPPDAKVKFLSGVDQIGRPGQNDLVDPKKKSRRPWIS